MLRIITDNNPSSPKKSRTNSWVKPSSNLQVFQSPRLYQTFAVSRFVNNQMSQAVDIKEDWCDLPSKFFEKSKFLGHQ